MEGWRERVNAEFKEEVRRKAQQISAVSKTMRRKESRELAHYVLREASHTYAYDWNLVEVLADHIDLLSEGPRQLRDWVTAEHEVAQAHGLI